jgi:hypothetical protein
VPNRPQREVCKSYYPVILAELPPFFSSPG